METFAVIGLSLLLLVCGTDADVAEHKYDPCCSLPCENNGICYTKGFDDYICDCSRTGYYGRNCETAEFYTKIITMLKPSKPTIHRIVTNYKYLWRLVNNITWLHRKLMKTILKIRIGVVTDPSPYDGFDEYTQWDTYVNTTVYSRTLPPVPKNCPTPMGVKGKKELPPAEEIAKKFLLRRKFRPCPARTNLIFPFYAQHFSHQFFKGNPKKGIPFQWGGHNIDCAHIYGHTPERTNALRSHVDGKMKVSVINGEVYPPSLDDAPGAMMYGSDILMKEHQFAFGHPGFSLMPSFLVFSTIWIREHNRVCDILKKEHPEWDDERLFQTARLIIIGETLKVTVEEYVQHISGFEFKLMYDPELLANEGLSYHNEIHVEFDTLYRWHALMPDVLRFKDRNYPIKDLLYNPGPILDLGIRHTLEDLSKQFAGQVPGGRNQGSSTLDVAKYIINVGRKLRFQPFNKYRVKIGLKPFRSFTELTGETEIAAELEEAYGDIDALELYVGLILEKGRAKSVFGETMTEMGSPYSLKGIYGNPISSPGWWKPVTFGGETGFNITKETTFQKLICRNVEGCPQISFKVPEGVEYEEICSAGSKGDNTSKIMMTLFRNPHLYPEYKASHELHVKQNPQVYHLHDGNVTMHKVKTEL